MVISKCFQKSRIEVNEDGTKAAAVTVATTVLGASLGELEDPGPLRFYADRPFIYQIVETSTGAILFMGVFRGE
jgi:serpin B